MKVNLQSVNFNADKSLIDFVEKKLNVLDKYYDKIVDADVFLKVQQTSEKENKIIQKWNKEREKFLNKNKEDINNMSAFSAKSKVLEILMSNRIDYFEQMIHKLSVETNIDDICKLVEYFINSTKEVK